MIQRQPRRRAALVAAIGGILAIQLSCAAVAAAQGVALDTGRITVETPLTAGKSYPIARLNVLNPGTVRTKYDIVATPIQTAAHTPAPSWFSFSPKQVSVQPGRQQAVSLSVRIPKNAPAGRYEILVGAQIAPARGGMAIAAGAAARVTFTVTSQAAAADAIVSALPAWWPVPAAAFLVAGAWFGRARFRLRSPIARR